MYWLSKHKILWGENKSRCCGACPMQKSLTLAVKIQALNLWVKTHI
jgi:hypothetical protein